MSDTPHELHQEFPEHAARITQLKTGNAHFKGLSETYHTLNRTIHRGETNVEPMDDFHLEDLRKQRLKLKDELFGMLQG